MAARPADYIVAGSELVVCRSGSQGFLRKLLPFPEEMNGKIVEILAGLCFSPTEAAEGGLDMDMAIFHQG